LAGFQSIAEQAVILTSDSSPALVARILCFVAGLIIITWGVADHTKSTNGIARFRSVTEETIIAVYVGYAEIDLYGTVTGFRIARLIRRTRHCNVSAAKERAALVSGTCVVVIAIDWRIAAFAIETIIDRA